MIETLLNDIWYGETDKYKKYSSGNVEYNLLANLLCEFQHGNFDRVPELVELENRSQDLKFREVILKLFLSVANHKNLSLLKEFLADIEEDEVSNFCYYAESSMSLQCIPHLLSLSDIWEDTMPGIEICYTIGYMLNYIPAQDGYCPMNQLTSAYKNFSSKHSPELYYYCGKEFFVGDLTKILIMDVMKYRDEEQPFVSDEIPYFLSTVTGIKCPIQSDSIINDNKVEQVIDYIKVISGF